MTYALKYDFINTFNDDVYYKSWISIKFSTEMHLSFCSPLRCEWLNGSPLRCEWLNENVCLCKITNNPEVSYLLFIINFFNGLMFNGFILILGFADKCIIKNPYLVFQSRTYRHIENVEVSSYVNPFLSLRFLSHLITNSYFWKSLSTIILYYCDDMFLSVPNYFAERPQIDICK